MVDPEIRCGNGNTPFLYDHEIAGCANWSHSLEPADLPMFTLTIRNSRRTRKVEK